METRDFCSPGLLVRTVKRPLGLIALTSGHNRVKLYLIALESESRIEERYPHSHHIFPEKVLGANGFFPSS